MFTLLTCATLALAQDILDEDYHPGPAEVRDMQKACAVNEAGTLALQEQLGKAITDWNSATAQARPAAALRQLGDFLDRVRQEGHLSGRKEMYVLCVEKAVRQFVEVRREKPQPVTGSGSSKPLQLSSFSSEEEIWRSGCQQAQEDAITRLQLRCADRTLVVVTSQCPQVSGTVRTYTAEVQGECRGK